MSSDELLFIHRRTMRMVQYLLHTPRDQFSAACKIYGAIGRTIRAEIVERTGHAPEEYETAYPATDGTEPSSRYQPTTVQRLPLLSDEDM